MPYPYNTLAELLTDIETRIIENNSKDISGQELQDILKGIWDYLPPSTGAPIIMSITVMTPTKVRIVFDKIVQITNANGCSFASPTNNPITSVIGGDTNTLTFTLQNAFTNTSVVTFSYNPGAGNIVSIDAGGNPSELEVVTNFPALNILQASGPGGGGGDVVVQTLTDGPTVTMDLSLGTWGVWEIAGNRTFEITGLTAGDAGLIYIYQDATGGREVTWPIAAKLPSGGINLSNKPNELTVVEYAFDGTELIFDRKNYDTTLPIGHTTAPVTTATTNVSLVLGVDQILTGLLILPSANLTGFQIGTAPGLDDIVSYQDIVADGKWKSFAILYRPAVSETWYVEGISGTVLIQPIKVQI